MMLLFNLVLLSDLYFLTYRVCIPAFIRFVQCLKRFKDSRLKIHLVNAGKYVASMLQLALFTYWRSRGSRVHDHSFAIWAT